MGAGVGRRPEFGRRLDRDDEACLARASASSAPAVHPCGKVAVFEDLYANLRDLVQFA